MLLTLTKLFIDLDQGMAKLRTNRGSCESFEGANVRLKLGWLRHFSPIPAAILAVKMSYFVHAQTLVEADRHQSRRPQTAPRLISAVLEWPVGLIAVVILGALIRLENLQAHSLWFGEAFSWWLAQSSLSEIAAQCSEGIDTPLYYVLLKGWIGLFGDSVFSMRLMSLSFDIVAMILLYRFSWELATEYRLKERDVSFLATVLAALSIFRVTQAREMRMYPLGELLAIASSWLLWRALRTDGLRCAWNAIGYATAVIALPYTHSYGLFTVATQFIFAAGFLAMDRRRRPGLERRYILFGFLAIVLAYAPWLPVLHGQILRATQQFQTPPLDLGTAFGAVELMLSGDLYASTATAGVLAPLCVIAILSITARRRRAAGTFLILLTAVPFLMAVVVSFALGQNILSGRYLSFSFPFFLIAMALLVDAIPHPKGRTIIAWFLILEFGVQSIGASWQADTSRRPGLQAAAQLVASKYHSGDSVLTFDPDGFLTSSYYLRGKLQPLYLAEGDHYPPYERVVAFTGASRVSADQLSRRIRGRVWIISGDRAKRKENDIPTAWKQVGSWSFEDAALRRSHVYLRLFTTAMHDANEK